MGVSGARLRRRLVLALAALAGVAAGYFGWARDLAVFRVEKVVVSGATGPAAPELRAALTAATRGMTTLHVRESRLEQAAAAFPGVRSISSRAQLPDTLRIAVHEYEAVAEVVGGGGEAVPVTGDGRMLRDVEVAHRLPIVRARTAVAGATVEEPRARRLIRVVAEAPQPLGRRISRIHVTRGRGAAAVLRHGPTVYFGSTARLDAKWGAAARVLGHPSSAGAEYVDVRLPERPAAGPFQDTRPEVDSTGQPHPQPQG